jgi:hypothetical protein
MLSTAIGGQFDEVSIRTGVNALIHAARLAKIAIGHSEDHVDGATFHSIRLALLELEKPRELLYRRARARGWSVDPFVGLWGRIDWSR